MTAVVEADRFTEGWKLADVALKIPQRQARGRACLIWREMERPRSAGS
ncbi:MULTISPECIES: hypothetical protein [unclassified Caulobacter]|nr:MULTISPECIES: hypothetical protein [unclassified Caulobacter]